MDQPAGVGFSYGDRSGYDHNEEEVAEDMYKFLQAFFAKHSDLQGRPFFVFGESYGGHYAPAVSHRVFVGNQDPSNIWINLAGVAIGNGLTDPLVQYEYYPQLAFNYSIEKMGHPAVSEASYAKMRAAWPQCQSMIAECQNNHDVCPDAEDFCNNANLGPYESTGLNPYNIELKCGPNPLCYNFTNVNVFLNTERVQSALGVNKKWSSCNDVVNAGFGKDWMRNYQTQLPDLLNNGTRVLIYAGDLDFICNWLGNQAWTLALQWPHRADFNNARVYNWTVDGAAAGEGRTSNGFTFLRVFDAGHMVPKDQPKNAQTMLNELLDGGFH